MENTSETSRIPDREIFYQRARTENRIFSDLAAFFAARAEETGITKRDIATMLGRDPAQITRWLSEPSNLTLQTISDLLLALKGELDTSIHLFAERAAVNSVHPWMEEYWEQGGAARSSWNVTSGSAEVFGVNRQPTSTNVSTVVFVKPELAGV